MSSNIFFLLPKWRWLRKNIRNIIFSVILTTLIFTAYTLNLREEKSYDQYPVKITLPEGYRLLDSDKIRLNDITLASHSLLKKDFNKNDFPLNLKPDVSSKSVIDGKLTIEINDSDFHLPTGMSVVRHQGSISVNIDSRITRKTNVEVCFDSKELNSDYKVVSATPEHPVEIKGWYKDIKDILTVKTEPVPLKDANASFTYDAKLKPPVQDCELPKLVKVRLIIEKSMMQKEFRGIKLKILNNQGVDKLKYTLNSKQMEVNVKVKGPKKSIKSLTADSINAYIDVSSISKCGIWRLETKIKIEGHDDIKAESISPREIEIKAE